MITHREDDCFGLPTHNCVVHDVNDWLSAVRRHNVPKNNGPISGGGLSVISKWLWINSFLQCGFNVVFSDNDVAFVRDPLQWWWRPDPDMSYIYKYDIMGLSDNHPAYDNEKTDQNCTVGYKPKDVGSSLFEEYRGHYSCQSTGIMFFRNSTAARQTVKDYITEMANDASKTDGNETADGRWHTPHWEQAMWQPYPERLQRRYSGSYALLPTRFFMNMEFFNFKAAEGVYVAVHGGYKQGCKKWIWFWCHGFQIDWLTSSNQKCLRKVCPESEFPPTRSPEPGDESEFKRCCVAEGCFTAPFSFFLGEVWKRSEQMRR
jgi:hypothetical protein